MKSSVCVVLCGPSIVMIQFDDLFLQFKLLVGSLNYSYVYEVTLGKVCLVILLVK